MFILTRKVGEKIILGDEIVIALFSIAGGRVKLGIYAPRNISIKRMEMEVKEFFTRDQQES